MDAKQFLAEFGHIANAPGGVQRLRELVLNFAFKGGLETQTAYSISVENILQNLRYARLEKVRKKEIKQVKLKPLADEDHPWKIPDHWLWARMYDVFDVRDGTHDSPKYVTNGVPLITSKNLSSGKLDFSEVKYISYEDHKKISVRSGVEKFDVLFAMIGTIGHPIVVEIESVFSVKNIGLFKNYLPDFTSPYYLRYFLQLISLELRNNAAGGVQSFVSLGILRNIPFPLPPIEEQSRIVAKVDELMALCDKLETQQQKKRKLQNKLRQSVLQAVANAESPKELQDSWERLAGNFSHLFAEAADVAELRSLIMDLGVGGRLTSQEVSDTPVNVLLENIKNAKRNGIQRGDISALKPVVGEFLGESYIPNHWSQIMLDDALAMMDSGWSPKCLDSQKTDDDAWGVLKTTAVQKLHFISDENKQLPNSLKPKLQYEVHVGDILITRAGPSNRVGICCVVDKVSPKLMISDKIIRFRIVDDLIDARFVALSLSAGETARLLEKKKSGMASSQMNITQDRLRSLPILLPPREEQERILSKIQQMMRFCDTLEAKRSSAQKTAERLATAAIASLTGISTPQQEEPMKVPKTELKAPVRLGTVQPSSNTQAPLASLLARHNGEMGANDLWQRFGGEIDAFYAQLKTEVRHGWITEPTGAQMLEKEAD